MGRQCVLYITRISIHAPAKGATSHVVKISLSITYFNPRSREGSDYYGSATLSETNISIHAPAKGATVCEFKFNSRHHYFNPRSREGSDPMVSAHGGIPADFNPRSREGSDHGAGQSIK